MTQDIRQIRDITSKLIWLWIRLNGTLSPVEISRGLGMRRITVSHVLSRLKRGGHVIRSGYGKYRSSGGLECSPWGTNNNCTYKNGSELVSIRGPWERGITLESPKHGLSTDDLFLYINKKSEIYGVFRRVVGQDFRERRIPLGLLDRMAAGKVLELDGMGSAILDEVRTEAFSLQESGKIQNRWEYIFEHVQWCFVQAGWEWTKIPTAREEWELGRKRTISLAKNRLQEDFDADLNRRILDMADGNRADAEAFYGLIELVVNGLYEGHRPKKKGVAEKIAGSK